MVKKRCPARRSSHSRIGPRWCLDDVLLAQWGGAVLDNIEETLPQTSSFVNAHVESWRVPEENMQHAAIDNRSSLWILKFSHQILFPFTHLDIIITFPATSTCSARVDSPILISCLTYFFVKFAVGSQAETHQIPEKPVTSQPLFDQWRW